MPDGYDSNILDSLKLYNERVNTNSVLCMCIFVYILCVYFDPIHRMCTFL